jgi:hypothetical protein
MAAPYADGGYICIRPDKRFCTYRLSNVLPRACRQFLADYPDGAHECIGSGKSIIASAPDSISKSGCCAVTTQSETLHFLGSDSALH